MRNFITWMLVLYVVSVSGQNSLEECYIDVVTGDTVLATKWRELHADYHLLINYRVSRINEAVALELKFHVGPYGTFSISDTNSLWITLLKDEIIRLQCATTDIAVKAGGAIGVTGKTVNGVHAIYPVPKEDLLRLQSHMMTNITISYSSGLVSTPVKAPSVSFSDDFRIISQMPRHIKEKQVDRPRNADGHISGNMDEKSCDTVDYSLVYVLYNHGGHTCHFPLYFNDTYILKLRNQNRLCYKIYSEGELTVKRFDGTKTGPTVTLNLEHGKFYGIIIEVPYPHGLDPNKRFGMIVVTDYTEFHQFLQEDFYGFKPFPSEDFSFEENRSTPLIP